MKQLVLESWTAKQVADFTIQPSQALLILGPTGAGKLTLAKAITAELLGVSIDKLDRQPYVRYVTPTNGTISIDDIRQLQSTLQLKTVGAESIIRRFIIVESAEALTIEAQNALLKSLEEPPADTVIMLTATSLSALLPTITSRTQHLTLRTPSLEALYAHFKPQFTDSAIEHAYRLSDGLPGIMTGLLEDNESHPIATAVESVKQWLRASQYERLLLVDQLAKQKSELDILFEGLERIGQAALLQASEKRQLTALRRWLHIVRLATKTRQAYARNTQPKLLLTHLMLEL